jgi:hypothetical protein
MCMRIRLAVDMFLAIPASTARVSNGIECTTRLMCLLNVMQHETVHALMHLDCADRKEGAGPPHNREQDADYVVHGVIFRKIVQTLFGHTEYVHCLKSPIAPSMLTPGDPIEVLVPLHGTKTNVWTPATFIKQSDSKYAIIQINGGWMDKRKLVVRYSKLRPQTIFL